MGFRKERKKERKKERRWGNHLLTNINLYYNN
jgi:hypothetical protein